MKFTLKIFLAHLIVLSTGLATLLAALGLVNLLRHAGRLLPGPVLLFVLVGAVGFGLVLGYLAQRRWLFGRKGALSAWILMGTTCVAALGASAFYQPILHGIGAALYLEQAPQKSDGIWILGTAAERYARGTQLYKQGYAPQVLMSLGTRGVSLLFESETIKTNVDAIRDYIMRQGVPNNAIRFFEAENTYEEALHARRYVRENDIQSLLVVSSPAHMLRVKMIFDHVVSPLATLHYTPLHLGQSAFKRDWWTSTFSLGRVIYEYLSIPYYWLRYILLGNAFS